MSAFAEHELVVGPVGSGKTSLARVGLARDHAKGAQVWIVDRHQGMPDWQDQAARYVTSIPAARALFAELAGRRPGNKPVTITIDDAHQVLKDTTCRTQVEHLLHQARLTGVRIRMVTNSLHLSSFGGSALIRSVMTAGTVHTPAAANAADR